MNLRLSPRSDSITDVPADPVDPVDDRPEPAPEIPALISEVPDLPPVDTPEVPAGKPAREPSELRRVVRLLARYAGGPRLYLVALGLLILEAVTAVFQAYPIAFLVDFLRGDRPALDVVNVSWLSSPRAETLLVLTVGLVLLTMVNSLADSLAEISLARGGRRLGYNLRETLYERLHRLSVAFHDNRRTGDMLTRVTSDVTAVEEFVVNSVSDLLGSVLVLVGTLAFLLWQSWQVAVVAMLLVPLLALVSNYFSQRIKVASKTLRAREGDLASVAQEMLSSIRVIQTYGRSGYEERRFAEQSHQAVVASLETASLKAQFSWLVAVLEAVAISAVAWLGLWLVDHRAVTVGTLVLFIILIQNMFKPTRKIIREWTLIGKVFASVERIAEVLQREPKVRDCPGALVAAPFEGRLTFDAVDFAYQLEAEDAGDQATSPGRRTALRDVSFDIPPGQVVALVGASGAGKSTIAQLIPRLYDPDSGQVRIDGVDIRDVTLESLRAQIGVVLQDTVLFSGTVAENIAYGREDATASEVVQAAVMANADGFITGLPEGYETMLGERGANLSGGQRQRIAIARAFVRNSPIVILDEPTTGLDSVATEQVLAGLHTLMQGKTTVIISHDLHLIRAADLIIVLEAGRIVQAGTHQSLLAGPGPYAGFCAKQGLVATDEAQEVSSNGRLHDPTAASATSAPSAASAPSAGTVEPVAPDGGSPSVPGDLDLTAGRLPESLEDLVLALDPQLMAAELQACLFGGAGSRYSVQRCTPGKGMFLGPAGLSLRYEVEVRDLDTGEDRHQLVLGRLFASAVQAERYLRQLDPLVAQAQARSDMDGLTCSAAAPAFPSLILHPFPVDHDLPPRAPRHSAESVNLAPRVHPFPVDPELPTLMEATDPQRMHSFFSGALARSGWDVERFGVELGHYGRRHRCVLRYQLGAQSSGSVPVSSLTVYGKVYAGETGPLVARVLAGARPHGGCSDDARLTLPRHLGYRPNLRLSLLSSVPGQPVIAEVIRAACQGLPVRPGLPGMEEAVDDAAEVLASVHGWPISSVPERTLAGDVAGLRQLVVEMKQISPELAGHLLGLLDAIEAGARATAGGGDCFSHGDFTLTQLLHDGRSIGLVDFDSACRAEPALDLGHFLAYLDMTVAKHRRSTEAGELLSEQLAERFLSTYRERDPLSAGGAVQGERVGIYRALSLLRITVHSWQKLKPRRTRLVLPVLEDRVRRLS